MRSSRLVPGAVRATATSAPSAGAWRTRDGRRRRGRARRMRHALPLRSPGRRPSPVVAGPAAAVTRQPRRGRRRPPVPGHARLERGPDGAAEAAGRRRRCSAAARPATRRRSSSAATRSTDVTATTPLVAPVPRWSERTVATAAQRADVVELLTWAPRSNGRRGRARSWPATRRHTSSARPTATRPCGWRPRPTRTPARPRRTATSSRVPRSASPLDAMFGAGQPPPGQPRLHARGVGPSRRRPQPGPGG